MNRIREHDSCRPHIFNIDVDKFICLMALSSGKNACEMKNDKFWIGSKSIENVFKKNPMNGQIFVVAYLSLSSQFLFHTIYFTLI